MIGLDTNVIVRYLVRDDAEQTVAATELIEGLSDEEPGFVSLPVVVELYWVLTRRYEIDRAGAVAAVRGLVEASELVMERPGIVVRALRRAGAGADLADALIADLALDAGCRVTMTFDRRASRGVGMELLASSSA